MKNQRSGKGLISWALYDWANSSYFVIIQTFVFAAYFAKAIAENEIDGTNQWSNMISLSGIMLAITAPFFGAIADQGGRRKPWIFVFTVMSVVASALLWFAKPSPDYIFFSLVVGFFASLGAEYAFIFYSAMLPDLVPEEKMGRWSGWGWGLGYAGGLACLLVALYLFIEPGGQWLGLDTSQSEEIRATFILTAIWYALFSIPMFLKTPDTPSKSKKVSEAVKMGYTQLMETVREVKQYKNIVRFLIARMIYNDAVVLIYGFGGIYAAGTFNMEASEILLFGVGLNVTAGIGAFSFAWLDDKLGSKQTIIWSLMGLAIPVIAVIFTKSVTWFMIWGLVLGVFFGPVQSASRTLIGRLAPDGMKNQMFGLFALSGKATAFIGSKLVGLTTVWFASQRAGMGVILVLLLIGFILMLGVKEKTESEPAL